jgi:hypothetical protein
MSDIPCREVCALSVSVFKTLALGQTLLEEPLNEHTQDNLAVFGRVVRCVQ